MCIELFRIVLVVGGGCASFLLRGSPQFGVDCLEHVHVVEDFVSVHLAVDESVLGHLRLLLHLRPQELGRVVVVLLHLLRHLLVLAQHVLSVLRPDVRLLLVPFVLLLLTLLLLLHLNK